MTVLYMFDDVNVDLIPADAEIVAYYGDGIFANGTAIRQRCKHATLVEIAVRASFDGQALDVEPGDASNVQAAGWIRRQLARGVWLPVVYTSAGNVDALVAVLAAEGLSHGVHYRLWSAHYGRGPHFCGPATCGLCRTPADWTQYTDHANGVSLDESVLPGIPTFTKPVPSGPTGPHKPVWPAGVILKLGSKGDAVRVLQEALRVSGIRGVRGITVDGDFGQQTDTAVRNYQAHEHLTVDGIAGRDTRNALHV